MQGVGEGCGGVDRYGGMGMRFGGMDRCVEGGGCVYVGLGSMWWGV